jgi:hypothetical protein
VAADAAAAAAQDFHAYYGWIHVGMVADDSITQQHCGPRSNVNTNLVNRQHSDGNDAREPCTDLQHTSLLDLNCAEAMYNHTPSPAAC